MSLTVLNLSGGSYSWEAHKFTGGIPSEWGALTNLKELKMKNCGLDGKPPSTRSERSYFFVFAESMPCCSGRTLPETLKLLAPLANLEVLSLSGNQLGGTITADVAAFTKLEKLELSRMGLIRISPFSPFSAQLPKEFGKLVNLTYFDASHNSLSGPLVHSTPGLAASCFTDVLTSWQENCPRNSADL